eukprot:Seg1166.2 transcript_id=Seg1166.2/GoldUCD/mRNA.D3Y31 product="hypothetical protein" protein_id=Seg1166.2/GoldUCD/D3Y31
MNISTGPKKKCRLSYSITFKLAAVRHAEINGNRATARYLGINEKQIRDWRSKKMSLMNTNCNAKRLKGAGRQANDANKSKNASSPEDVQGKEFKMDSSQRSFIENIENIAREKKLQMTTEWMHRWKIRQPMLIQRSDNLDIMRAFSLPGVLMYGPRYDYGVTKNLEKEREFHEKITCALALLDLKTAIIIHKYSQK